MGQLLDSRVLGPSKGYRRSSRSGPRIGPGRFVPEIRPQFQDDPMERTVKM